MTVKQGAYEYPGCIVCGDPLVRKRTGRPRRFCSDACRQRDYREYGKWIEATVDAALANEPEPAQDWRYKTDQAGR